MELSHWAATLNISLNSRAHQIYMSDCCMLCVTDLLYAFPSTIGGGSLVGRIKHFSLGLENFDTNFSMSLECFLVKPASASSAFNKLHLWVCKAIEEGRRSMNIRGITALDRIMCLNEFRSIKVTGHFSQDSHIRTGPHHHSELKMGGTPMVDWSSSAKVLCSSQSGFVGQTAGPERSWQSCEEDCSRKTSYSIRLEVTLKYSSFRRKCLGWVELKIIFPLFLITPFNDCCLQWLESYSRQAPHDRPVHTPDKHRLGGIALP